MSVSSVGSPLLGHITVRKRADQMFHVPTSYPLCLVFLPFLCFFILLLLRPEMHHGAVRR